MYAAFITIFGFFMVAPRMHERYLYPALVFAIPLAIESSEMLALFGILSLTCLFNLTYILHVLQTIVFLDSRDVPAMVASAITWCCWGWQSTTELRDWKGLRKASSIWRSSPRRSFRSDRRTCLPRTSRRCRHGTRPIASRSSRCWLSVR